MYAMYMALHITNPAVEQSARELAAVTGESITDAVGKALEQRLLRERYASRKLPMPSAEEMMDLIRSFNLQPINEDRTEDEILGYGPEGFSD